jgi:hypothetical protein
LNAYSNTFGRKWPDRMDDGWSSSGVILPLSTIGKRCGNNIIDAMGFDDYIIYSNAER